MAVHNLPKVRAWVRFPSPAQHAFVRLLPGTFETGGVPALEHRFDSGILLQDKISIAYFPCALIFHEACVVLAIFVNWTMGMLGAGAIAFLAFAH